MGELVDKIKGNVNELVGKAKEAIGEHNHDDKLTAEGEAQQVEGKGQQMKGSVKGALGDNI
ncbi:CsbD family protein [uncultured Sphingomonas sp.]|uniref:CsbD family protein n=1 Tax=uncultured Sphingomonas sp. TaxID=158754 RepID=UPI0025FAD877|nr:CsbD family protein [uncultured Sphingomonas sp.]